MASVQYMSNADLGPATTLKSSLRINMFLLPVTDYFYFLVKTNTATENS